MKSTGIEAQRNLGKIIRIEQSYLLAPLCSSIAVGNDETELERVLTASLEDSRQDQDPLPLQQFALNTEAKDKRFVQFKIEEWWGHGGGLQYFSIVESQSGNSN